jgi:hypothetical protein
MMMYSFQALLAAYEVFEQQKTITIEVSDPQFPLTQDEFSFIEAQQYCLDLMRPHLATDARIVLKTLQFNAFLKSLLQLGKDGSSPVDGLHVTATPVAWLLNSVPTALHLREIELIECDTADGMNETTVIRMQVGSEEWQQLIHVSAHSIERRFGVAVAIEQIVNQFQLPNDDHYHDESLAQLNQVALQEIACLVLYMAGLFNIGRGTV